MQSLTSPELPEADLFICKGNSHILRHPTYKVLLAGLVLKGAPFEMISYNYVKSRPRGRVARESCLMGRIPFASAIAPRSLPRRRSATLV